MTTDEPGRHFVLRSYHAGAFDVGTPVYFRKIRVGEVMSSELDPSGEFVAMRIFVHAPHDARVRTDTRFWNASGFDVAAERRGRERRHRVASSSILIGGIAFDTPHGAASAAAADGRGLPALREPRGHRAARLHPEGDLAAPLRPVGARSRASARPSSSAASRSARCTDVRLEFDRGEAGFRIPVHRRGRAGAHREPAS